MSGLLGGWSGADSAGLVVAGRVEPEAANQVSPVAVDDPDVEVGDQQGDLGAGVEAAEADVVQPGVMIWAPSPLRDELVVLTNRTLVNRCLRLRPRPTTCSRSAMNRSGSHGRSQHEISPSEREPT